VLPGAVARAVPELTRAITASAGITDVDAGIGVADALKAADLNLYLAKASGRDRSQGLAPFTITPSAPRSVAAAA
jgi:PleD family two-component response regulator